MLRALCVTTLILAVLTSLSHAFTTKATGIRPMNKSQAINAKPAPSIHTAVKNIVLHKIEGGYIYSRDGQAFQINPTTKIIDNSDKNSSKMRIAELFFQRGILVAVSIK